MSWSHPGPVWVHPTGYETGGMIWIGNVPCAESDIEAMRETLANPNAQPDPLSLVGRWHPDYSTFGNEHNPSAPKNGGLGSFAYEMQKVGEDGVAFTKEEIWYYGKDGKSVKGIPPEAGAYHRDMYYEAWEGPKPGSPAEAYRGTGEFYWDEENQWYDVRNRSVEDEDTAVKCPHCGEPL